MRLGIYMLEMLLLVGPIVVAGVVAIPIVLLLVAASMGFKTETKFKNPYVWATVVAAVISAFIVWPGYAQTVSDCRELERTTSTSALLAAALGIDVTGARMTALEKNCNDLIVRW